MKMPLLLSLLRERDIHVRADGGQLRCSAPPGALTFELQEELRQHKSEILEFLQSAASLARQQRAIVPLQPRGTGPPAFAFGGHNGDVFCFRALARHLGEDQPLFGLEPPGLDGVTKPLTRVEDLAAFFANEIRAFQPNGPYVIIGFCAGGTIAFELARQLLRDGAALSAVALFGAPFPNAYRRLPRLRKRFEAWAERLLKHARALAALPTGESRRYIAEKLRGRRHDRAGARPATGNPLLANRARVERAMFAALRGYVPGYFGGRLNLFLPCKEWADSREQPLRWRTVALRTEEYFGPRGCCTDTMLHEPYVPIFAGLFRKCRGAPNRELGRVAPVLRGGFAPETVSKR